MLKTSGSMFTTDVRESSASRKSRIQPAVSQPIGYRHFLSMPRESDYKLHGASMGDNDQAMHWLERAYEERFNPSILLRSGFDPVRSDSRFQNLVQRIGLRGVLRSLCRYQGLLLEIEF